MPNFIKYWAPAKLNVPQGPKFWAPRFAAASGGPTLSRLSSVPAHGSTNSPRRLDTFRFTEHSMSGMYRYDRDRGTPILNKY